MISSARSDFPPPTSASSERICERRARGVGEVVRGRGDRLRTEGAKGLAEHDLHGIAGGERLQSSHRRRLPRKAGGGGGGVGDIRREDFGGNLLIIDGSGELPPALHLREEPNGQRRPNVREEIDPIRHVALAAEPVDNVAGEGVFDRGSLGGMPIPKLDDFARHRPSLRGARRMEGVLGHGNAADQGFEGAGVLLREAMRGDEGAARVPGPEVARQRKQIPRALLEDDFIKGFGREDAVDLAPLHVGRHEGRRNLTNGNVAEGIYPVLREVIAEQIELH